MAATQTTLVYNDLKSKILRSGYSASESLPEAELATTYSVSRNTIKKALMMLESEGLVSIEPNKGAKVRAYSKQEVIEYLEVREVLEEYLMRLTVPLLTQSDIERMRESMAEMVVCKEEGRLMDYSASNRAFHRVVYDACPNRTLAQMIINLKNQMSKYNSKTVLIPGRVDAGYREHSAILEAIVARDVDAAAKLTAQHIRGVRNTFDKNFDLLF